MDDPKTIDTMKLSTEDDAKCVVTNVSSDFCQPKSEIYDAYQFYNRIQMETESFDSFLTDLRKLVLPCEFQESDRMIRDRIVMGIKDKRLQRKFIETEKLNLTTTIGMARVAEAERLWTESSNTEKEYTSEASLLTLNEDCLRYLFDFLEAEDSINLSKSCTRLEDIGDLVFVKYSDFTLDTTILEKGDNCIKYVFSNIGNRVSTLFVNSYKHQHLNMSQLLETIFANCKNIKTLQIYQWDGETYAEDPALFNAYIVEQLTLEQCNFKFTETFLPNFHNLKFFMFTFSNSYDVETFLFNNEGFRMVFLNNPHIKTFYYKNYNSDFDFDCQILELIPVEKLCLDAPNGGNFSNLNSLLKLNQLTKLRICHHYRANNSSFFCALTKEMNNLEELEILGTAVGEDFINKLHSLKKLRLLHLELIESEESESESESESVLKPSINWPKNLKILRLCNSFITPTQCSYQLFDN